MKHLKTFSFIVITLAATAYAAHGDPVAKKPESAEAQIRATLNTTADGWYR